MKGNLSELPVSEQNMLLEEEADVEANLVTEVREVEKESETHLIENT